MAKTRGRKATTLDSVAIAAGSALGRLAAQIDSLTKQREALTTEIQRYARQAESALKGLAAGRNAFGGTLPKIARKTAVRKRRKMSAAARRTTPSAGSSSSVYRHPGAAGAGHEALCNEDRLGRLLGAAAAVAVKGGSDLEGPLEGRSGE